MPGGGDELGGHPASAATVQECATLNLKGSGKLFDLYPLIRPAGLAGARDSFGTRDCVQPEKGSQERVSFPKRSNYQPPWLTSPDEVSPRAAGVKRLEVGGDTSLKRLLSNQAPTSEMERFLLERREAVYRSTWTKPLGKSQIRGLRLSDATKAPNFRFGIKQTTDETNAAKKLIFPQDAPSNSEQDERLYQKTHRDYPPGQQVDRHYEVKHIDLRDFRFGKSYAKEVEGVKECLSGSRDAGGSTDESSKAVEDYRRICYPEVGKTALSVAGNPDVPIDFAFGLVTHRDPATVEECLQGSYSLAEQQPDADLGRSRAFRALTKGFFLQDGSASLSADGIPPSKLSSAFQRFLSNPAFQTQSERRFGVPSIRTDIAPPKKRRIDDCVNYDDELSVGQLLTPAPFEAWGVSDEAFLIPRPRDKLLDLVRNSVGLSYADRPMLEQAVDIALGRKATEHPTTQDGSTQQVMASFMDVLNVFTRMLDERIAQETCSLTQTDRLRLF